MKNLKKVFGFSIMFILFSIASIAQENQRGFRQDLHEISGEIEEFEKKLGYKFYRHEGVVNFAPKERGFTITNGATWEIKKVCINKEEAFLIIDTEKNNTLYHVWYKKYLYANVYMSKEKRKMYIFDEKLLLVEDHSTHDQRIMEIREFLKHFLKEE